MLDFQLPCYLRLILWFVCTFQIKHSLCDPAFLDFPWEKNSKKITISSFFPPWNYGQDLLGSINPVSHWLLRSKNSKRCTFSLIFFSNYTVLIKVFSRTPPQNKGSRWLKRKYLGTRGWILCCKKRPNQMKRCLRRMIPGGRVFFYWVMTKKTSKRERPGFLVDQHDYEKVHEKYHF